MSKEGVRIFNFKIKKFIDKSSNADLKGSFFGVFVSNEINYFVNSHHLIRKKDAQYPFTILTTSRSDKAGMHWWNILDLHSQKRNIFILFIWAIGFEKLHNTRRLKNNQ